MNEYYLTPDGNIAQGDALIYEMDLAEKEVVLKAIALLNQGKGVSGWDELFDELIKSGCEETACGCMRIPKHPEYADHPAWLNFNSREWDSEY